MEKKYAEKCLASFLHTPADGGFFFFFWFWMSRRQTSINEFGRHHGRVAFGCCSGHLEMR